MKIVHSSRELNVEEGLALLTNNLFTTIPHFPASSIFQVRGICLLARNTGFTTAYRGEFP